MKSFLLYLLLILVIAIPAVSAQGTHESSHKALYPYATRVLDSVMAMQVPLLKVPPACRNRAIPAVVDNTVYSWWPGIFNQGYFSSCQQYAGVVYTFASEINRLRHLNGNSWENRYPANYTWNFMNRGEQFTGVNFLQSFDVIRRQGHITNSDFIWDTVGQKLVWPNGYDKYFRGMHNRIRQVYAIEINSEAGINTMKQYLYDHLDGSPTGGVACFTIDSYALNNMSQLPPGTPEAGKHVVVTWPADPTHGLTIVGYNDSIRSDINNDGKFTNNTDINGDGVVDARDWEIGGFRLANSYGDDFADSGYCYTLYSAMARNHEEGGVWNNRVYVVEADTGYSPLLALKARLNYNHRTNIRLLAGINTDTLASMPSKTMTFPIFNFQGGDHEMAGIDTASGDKSLELGLDITPLLDVVPPGKPVRLFFGVEERDTTHTGSGIMQYASFLSYLGEAAEFPSPESNVTIRDNEVTLVSAVVSLPVSDKVQITTEEVPVLTPPAPYSVQLQATGGRSPYHWNLCEEYLKQPVAGALPAGIETPLVRLSEYRPYAAVKLPFSFPFYGKIYDSLYINFYGFVAFEPQSIPAPYITDECTMLNYFPVISPAFSQNYTFIPAKGDGVFMRADSSCLHIRWKASIASHETGSSENFVLILYPDGHFVYLYGAMDGAKVLPVIYEGVAKGDQVNGTIEPCLQMPAMQENGYCYLPPQIPPGIELTRDGLLTVTHSDTSRIYNIKVKVTDGHALSDTRTFHLSSELDITAEVYPGGDGALQFGTSAGLNLVVKNRGQAPVSALQLRLAAADSTCLVTDSLASAGTLQPGASETLHNLFSFGLTKSLPDGYPVRMGLYAQSGQRKWYLVLDIPVTAPQIEILQPAIADGDNHMLDPGEVADLVIQVENRGTLAEEDVELTLQSADTTVTIRSPEKQTIGRCGAFTSHQLLFRLQRSRWVLPGSVSPMKALVTSGSTVIRELDFELPAGKKYLAIVNLVKPTGSLNAMASALDSLNVPYDTISHLGFEYENYQALFLILGNAAQGNYSIQHEDATQLATYLGLGGNMYMEGYFTWHYQSRTVLHPMFRYSHTTSLKYYFDHADGVEGTFTDAMSFPYSGELNYALFSVTPTSPAYSLFENRDDPPHCLEFAYDGADYKTIGTLLEFAGKTDSAPASTRKLLMQRYLDFFGLNLTGLHPLFHVSESSVCTGTSVSFTDDSFNDITAWQWEFPGGTPAVSNLRNPVVIYDMPGTFDVKLTVSDGSNTRSLVRKGYVTVKSCSAVVPVAKKVQINIFPNPTHDRVTISIGNGIKGECDILLIDYTGRIMKTLRNIGLNNQGTTVVNFPGFEKGIYLLIITINGLTATAKLIID